MIAVLPYVIHAKTAVLGRAGGRGQCLAYFGRTSLIIMCVHEPLKRIILMVLSKVISMSTDVIRDEIGMSIVTTLIVVAVCIPVIEIINRKISWVIGKF